MVQVGNWKCLIAILENYQEADGSILIPEVLKNMLIIFQKFQKMAYWEVSENFSNK